MSRYTITHIKNAKGKKPLVALTSYHAHTAAIVDDFAEIILVGDSLGMVMHGMENTLGVPLDLMIMHGKAVVRGTKKALVVVDLPFGSYEASPEQAFHSAAAVMKQTGCGAVKLEGGERMAETVHFLSQRGIPVMAHIGLTPQGVLTMGGFKTQGKDQAGWPMHEADAQAVTQAGAFSIVLEGMVEPLAAKITQQVDIPTIGIGASAKCDGQILVLEDLLGLNPNPPKFVKVYGDLGEGIKNAVKSYADDVREHRFPSQDHLYFPD